MHFKINTIIKNHFLAVIIAFFTLFSSQAQDDLLDELDKETSNQIQFDLPAFKAMQIGNLQSTKIAAKGDLYLIVSHRFGAVSGGIDDFFGLDNANTKIQLTYSFWEGVQLSVSRDSFEKTYSGTLKVAVAKQSNKFPLNLVAYGSADINSQLDEVQYPFLEFGDRMSYTLQFLASRRVSEKLSLQVAPIYIRQNLQDINFTAGSTHNQFALGLGGRLKVSKRVSINADYALNFSREDNATYKDPLTIGLDIETGGHVFQLLFTNARGSNDSAFLAKATGNWLNDISFGFNVVRVF